VIDWLIDLFILYTSNIINIASRHGILVHLYADATQLYIKLSTQDINDVKTKIVACVKEIQSWCSAMRLKLNASKTELIWFDRKKPKDDDRAVKLLTSIQTAPLCPPKLCVTWEFYLVTNIGCALTALHCP